jgi:hypothetical protein
VSGRTAAKIVRAIANNSSIVTISPPPANRSKTVERGGTRPFFRLFMRRISIFQTIELNFGFWHLAVKLFATAWNIDKMAIIDIQCWRQRKM